MFWRAWPTVRQNCSSEKTPFEIRGWRTRICKNLWKKINVFCLDFFLFIKIFGNIVTSFCNICVRGWHLFLHANYFASLLNVVLTFVKLQSNFYFYFRIVQYMQYFIIIFFLWGYHSNMYKDLRIQLQKRIDLTALWQS